MKLEYRVLELEKDSIREDCNYCVLNLRAENLTFITATYEMVAYDDDENCADISVICDNCKKDLEDGVLPYCEECGRLKRQREYCFCSLRKDRPIQSSSSQSIEARLVKENKRIEKELKTAKKELKVEREEVVKFQEKSEEWNKRQKQELIKENKRLKEENGRLKNQLEKQQTAQIEVKEPKKWPWKLRK